LEASKISPESGYYQISQMFEILPRGDSSQELESELVQQAWQQVVDRHPALRTIFHDTLGQVVLKNHKADITILESEESEDTMRQQVGPLVLGSARPLHRMVIAKTAPRRVVCRMDIHHAITDGHSIIQMFEELAPAYSGSLPPGHGPSMHSYISQLSTLDRETALSHWKTALGNIKGPHQFPRRKPITGSAMDADSIRTGIYDLHSQIRNDRLPAFCQANESTMPSLIYATWGIVLRALGRANNNAHNDVVFAYLVSGRTLVPSEALGFLVNTVLHRDPLSEAEVTDARGTPLSSLLRRTHETVLAALPHTHIAPSELGLELRISSLINVRKFDNEYMAAIDADFDDAGSDADVKEGSCGIAFKAFPSSDPMAVSAFPVTFTLAKDM
jgi:hypothetical protein